MADVYSCLQKCVRRGEFAEAVYWGSQIALPDAASGFKGYPNGLKKRLMHYALEEAASLEYAVKLLTAKATTWAALVPWIKVLCEMPKTHATAALNRMAVAHVGNPGGAPTPEMRKTAEALVLHRDEMKKELVEMFSKDVLNVYKELNKEVLAFHADILRASLPLVNVPEPKAVEVLTTWLTTREVPDWSREDVTMAPAMFPEGDRYAEEARALCLNDKKPVRQILAASSTKAVAVKEEKVTAKKAAKETDKTEKTAAKKAAKESEKAEKTVAKKAVKETEKAKKAAAKEAAGPQYILASAPPPTYSRIVQIQPITRRGKARVWFATTNIAGKDTQVVLKGPVKEAEATAVMKTEALKKTLGLPHANVRLETHEDKTYIVADNVASDYTTFPTRQVTTKLEKDVTVVDVEKAALGTWNQVMLEDNMKTANLLVALAFRKVTGANDTCPRNMVIAGDAVYSVDDAAVEKETAHVWSKGLVKPKAAYEAALAKHWGTVSTTLAAWKAKVPADSYAAVHIEALSTQEGWKW